VDADARPSTVGPPFTGHFKVICDTPRGLQPWQPASDPVVIEGKKSADTDAKAAATPKSKADLNLEVGRNIYEADAKGSKVAKEKQANGEAQQTNGSTDAKSVEDLVKSAPSKINCFSCGIDCTRVHYHNIQAEQGTGTNKTKYDLCPNCHQESRFPSNQTKSSYVKVENPTYSTIPDRDAPWSDAETLRLLEALEQFDENWNEIAEHVGTRTKEECVVKFLQFEIEDKYLDAEPINKSTGISLLGPQHGHLPFSQADNPVMSVISFLSALAEPSVTAAAANKSVEAMRDSLRSQLEKSSDADKDKAKEQEKEKEADSMEIDVQHSTTTTTTTTTTTSALASIPLATMAARAGGLASHEEREMTRLVSAAVNVTLEKFELKLKQFSEMEAILQAERRELERGRQELFLERLKLKNRVRAVEDALKMSAESGDLGHLKKAQEITENGKMEFVNDVGQQGGLAAAGIEAPSSLGQAVKSYEI
jgi:SWI/SNF related-matrix-associated actin-dependent regulator of chromatin subfamily C